LQQPLRRNDGVVGKIGRLAHARAPAHARTMKTYFDHERLDVYREAIGFCGWVGELIGGIATKAAAKDQLDRASTSIPLNIAEGNGKFSAADRARFLEIARGSALECAACLDVLAVRKLIAGDQIIPAKEQLVRIVNMLMGMLKRFSGRAEFLREDEPTYYAEHEHEYEQEQESRQEQE
ncbi:MAG TPA: four helix bundle protein, partial [Chthoniobacterales bacterium]|nr:four helix bundle protein [Chthoniobacterales bacterium]